jgi:hypothetical protein
MRNNHFSEQTITIDFSIDNVKSGINRILTEKSVKYPHKKENINDIMGSYQFFELGINSVQLNLSLKDLGEGRTEITFRAVPDVTSKATSAGCAQSIAAFQGQLTAALSGQPLPKSSGCALLVLVGLASIIGTLSALL